MPKNTGHILNTPQQTWSTAGRDLTHSLLTRDIEHARKKRPSFVIVENTRSILKSSALQPAMDTLTQAGYSPILLEAGNTTLIVGQKK